MRHKIVHSLYTVATYMPVKGFYYGKMHVSNPLHRPYLGNVCFTPYHYDVALCNYWHGICKNCLQAR